MRSFCVDFPDGAAAPSLRQCYRWVFGSAERRLLLLIHHQELLERPIILLFHPFSPERCDEPFYLSAMADRDNLVYQAKLAEQAERYDGKAPFVQRSLQTAPAPLLRLPPHGSGDAGEATHMDLLG